MDARVNGTAWVCLLAAVVLGSSGCEVLVGDDWGWHGYPCNEDRHCQPSDGLACYWPAANPVCLDDEQWDALFCNNTDDCKDKLGADYEYKCESNHCGRVDDQGEYVDLVWCIINSDACPTGETCFQNLICVPTASQDFWRECTPGEQDCAEAGLVCSSFTNPNGVISQRCSDACISNTNCKERWDKSQCTWVGPGDGACADPAFTGGLLSYCTPGTDPEGCEGEYNVCTEVNDYPAALCTKTCGGQQNECPAWLECCAAENGGQKLCLPVGMCAPNCPEDCKPWEHCVIEQCKLNFPLLLETTSNEDRPSAAVSVVGENELLVALGGARAELVRFPLDGTPLYAVTPVREPLDSFATVDSLDFHPGQALEALLALTGVVDPDVEQFTILDTADGSTHGEIQVRKRRVAYSHAGAHLIAISGGNGNGNILLETFNPQSASPDGSRTMGTAGHLFRALDTSWNDGLAAVGTMIDGSGTGEVHVVNLNDMGHTTIESDPPLPPIDALAFTENSNHEPCLVIAARDAVDGMQIMLYRQAAAPAWDPVPTTITLGPDTVDIIAMEATADRTQADGYSWIFALDATNAELLVFYQSIETLKYLGVMPIASMGSVNATEIDISADGEWLTIPDNGVTRLYSVDDLVRHKIGYGFPCAEDLQCRGDHPFQQCLLDNAGGSKACNLDCESDRGGCGDGYCCASADGDTTWRCFTSLSIFCQ